MGRRRDGLQKHAKVGTDLTDGHADRPPAAGKARHGTGRTGRADPCPALPPATAGGSRRRGGTRHCGAWRARARQLCSRASSSAPSPSSTSAPTRTRCVPRAGRGRAARGGREGRGGRCARARAALGRHVAAAGLPTPGAGGTAAVTAGRAAGGASLPAGSPADGDARLGCAPTQGRASPVLAAFRQGSHCYFGCFRR